MIKEREHVLARMNQTIQTALSVVAFTLATILWHRSHWQELLHSREFSIYMLLVSLSGWIAVEYSGLHRMSREDSFADLFFRYLKVTFMGVGLVWFAAFWLDTHWLEWPQLALFAGIEMILLYSFKASFFKLMQLVRRRGFNTRQVLLLADGSSRDFLHDLLTTPDWGYQVFAVSTGSRSLRRAFASRVNMLPEDSPLEQLLDEVVIDELMYAKSRLNYEEINSLMELCAERGVVFRLRPGVSERHGLKPNFTVLNDNPLVVFRNIPENYLALKIKRGFDILTAMIALLVFSPFLLLIALAIKLDDGGPVFFHQQRVGLYGRRFACLKFRTMVTDAEALKATLMDQNEQAGPVFKMKYDPRITRVGRVLRKYSIDEFPQFLNVLNGDMSVVGPRPPIPAEVQQYRKSQNRRLSMKPGITCIWQVSGRNSLDFDHWVKLDMQYIDNWSLRLDLMIILKTVKVMIKGDGM